MQSGLWLPMMEIKYSEEDSLWSRSWRPAWSLEELYKCAPSWHVASDSVMVTAYSLIYVDGKSRRLVYHSMGLQGPSAGGAPPKRPTRGCALKFVYSFDSLTLATVQKIILIC